MYVAQGREIGGEFRGGSIIFRGFGRVYTCRAGFTFGWTLVSWSTPPVGRR